MDKETRKSERQKKEKAVLPVTDPKTFKSAAAYLLKIARSSEGRRRYCKQPKIDALRQCKEEILEAHRHGLAVHRIAQIFRERNVEISIPHLVRTIGRFIEEEEQTGGKSSTTQQHPASDSLGIKDGDQGPAVTEEMKFESKKPITYQVPDEPSSGTRKEDFAKQLRLARYLAAGSFPPSLQLNLVPEAGTSKPLERVTKATRRTKAEGVSKKPRAKGRLRTLRASAQRKTPLPGSHRSEKRRISLSR
jgi:hypothetical protein